MKKLLMALTAVIMLASCKKEKVNQPGAPPAGEKKLVKMTQVGSNYEESYEYDNMDRITKSEDTDDKYSFVFTGNSFTMKGIRKTDNNRVIADLAGTMDTEGRILSVTGIEQYNQNSPKTVHFTYEYDAQGYLIKLNKTYNGNTSVLYVHTYTNGDLTEVKYYTNGQLSYTNTYEYDLNAPNKLKTTPHCSLSPLVTVIEGKPNSHLLKGGKAVSGNVQSWTFTRTYEFDNDGYPVKQITIGTYWNNTQIFIYNK